MKIDGNFGRTNGPAVLAEMQPDPDPPEPLGDVIDETYLRAAEMSWDEFWTAMPQLQLIRTHAHHAMTAPLALLGEALLRVVGAVPPGICVPPIVLGPVSLNLFIGLVGATGQGKGGATAVADWVVTVRGGLAPVRLPVGTGEGLVKTFRWTDAKGNVDQSRSEQSVILTADEISTMAALSERSGSTLGSVIKTAYMGAPLGFTNAKSETRLHLPAHSYRLGLSIGIQPELADVLFRDTTGGTPQRFLFLPLVDPDFPDHDVAKPDRLIEVNVGHWAETGCDNIEIPDDYRKAIRKRRRDVVRYGGGDQLGSHRLLAHVKAAVALALLRGDLAVNGMDWLLAAKLQLASEQTVAAMQAAMLTDRDRRDAAQHARQAKGAVRTADELEKHRRAVMSNRVLRRLEEAPDHQVTRRRLLQNFAGSDRSAAVDVLDALVDQGMVTATEAGKKSVVISLVRR